MIESIKEWFCDWWLPMLLCLIPVALAAAGVVTALAGESADAMACKATCGPKAVRICYARVAVCAGPDGALEARQVMP